MPCSSKKGNTLSFKKSAAVKEVFSGYTFANPMLLWVSMPVCW